jgi:uncharacterized membrane protein YdbT with pleckstrin-like domain
MNNVPGVGAQPIPAHISAIERPAEKLMTYYVIKAALTLVAFPVTLTLLYFRYHTMRYRFDTEGIRMSWGILLRHEIMLNYSRIQDIHLESSFLERLLGLARIQIQTAASGSGADMTLEGLTDHVAMRDFLYSRMRGAHERQHAAEAGGDLTGTLQQIAGELRAIRVLVEEQRPRA